MTVLCWYWSTVQSLYPVYRPVQRLTYEHVQWPDSSLNFPFAVRHNTTEVHVRLYHGRDITDHDTLKFPHFLLACIQLLHEATVIDGKSQSLRLLRQVCPYSHMPKNSTIFKLDQHWSWNYVTAKSVIIHSTRYIHTQCAPYFVSVFQVKQWYWHQSVRENMKPRICFSTYST